MNKHLLSLIVLIGFTLFALYPASTKSIKEHSNVPIGLNTHQTTGFGDNHILASVKVRFPTFAAKTADLREVNINGRH